MNNQQKSPVEIIEWEWQPYPEKALDEILADREKYLPQIRQILQRVVEDPDFYVDEEDYNGHMFAVYLLSQWRDTDSFQLILDAFSGDSIENIWGDVMHEVGKFIVSTFSGDVRTVVDFIKNPDFNSFVRMNAFGGLVNIYYQEQLERQQLIEIAREIFSDCSRPEETILLSGLVCECCRFYSPELDQDIGRLFEEKLIDDMWVDYESYKECNENRDRETEEKDDSFCKPVCDIHQELKKWDMFSSPTGAASQNTNSARNNGADNYYDDDYSDKDNAASLSQKQAPAEKYPGTGRNDNCPCGSGKKYKKCCLA